MTKAWCTVIMPVRNGAASIATALESVGRQGGHVDKVVVIDDHSDDESADVARSFGAVVIDSQGAGAAAARNQGALLCETEYLAFLDSDDEWEDGYLEEASHLRNNSFIVGSVRRVREGIVSDIVRDMPALTTGLDLLIKNPITTSGVILDIELFRQAGGFPSQVRYCEDLALWLRIIDLNSIPVPSPGVVRYHSYGRTESLAAIADAEAHRSKVAIDYFVAHPGINESQRISVYRSIQRDIGRRMLVSGHHAEAAVMLLRARSPLAAAALLPQRVFRSLRSNLPETYRTMFR